MANSIVARLLGDEYQQLVFWKYALDMLDENYHISSIIYEDAEVKSFDDVVIKYNKPQNFRDTNYVSKYIQVKFHMREDNFITLDNLMNPSFVSASRYSFLDKAVAAYRKMGDYYEKCVFEMYTPYDIKQEDELYDLISNVDRTFCLEKLFDGTTDASRMGKIRSKLKERLGVDEDELKAVLRQIRINNRSETIDQLIDVLNTKLEKNRLRIISDSERIEQYTSLHRSLFKRGIKEYDKELLRRELKEAGLFSESRDSIGIAVRSYIYHAEDLDKEAFSILKLEDYFQDRKLKDGYDWKNTIYPELKAFLNAELDDQEKDYFLRFEANPTVAFMAGRILDIKSGKNIILVQRGEKGLELWDNISSDIPYPEAEINNQIIDEANNDVAVVIGLSRDIINDVKEYIDSEEIKVRRIIEMKLSPQSSSSVIDGRHAWILANQIKNVIDRRILTEKRGILHLFIACPISIVFWLGRYSLSYGNVQMYDYDLLKVDSCTYYPTMLFPSGEVL